MAAGNRSGGSVDTSKAPAMRAACRRSNVYFMEESKKRLGDGVVCKT